MPPSGTKAKAQAKAEEAVGVENRVDEFAISVFTQLGYEGRLPDGLSEAYNDFKRTSDRVRGFGKRLSPGEFASVVCLYKQGSK